MVNMISSTVKGMSKGKEIDEVPYLGPHESLYHAIHPASDAYFDEQHLVMSDPYHLPYWIDSPLLTLDYLLQDFSSDESIMKIMSLDKP